MKKVLITGVSGGIGSAAAELFLQSGWDVSGTDIKMGDVCAGLNRFWEGDASDPTLWKEIAAASEFRDGLDALVNNAAVQLSKSIMDTADDEWDRVMAVNLRSVFLGTKYLIPLLQKKASAIVNISSVHAAATSKNIAAYAASKGALVAFTRAAALELASKQIRVNALMPGATDTRMLEDGLERGHLNGDNLVSLKVALAKKTPAGRIGRAMEIAQAIYFLADSERSSFVTGQTLVVDGGALARLSTE